MKDFSTAVTENRQIILSDKFYSAPDDLKKSKSDHTFVFQRIGYQPFKIHWRLDNQDFHSLNDLEREYQRIQNLYFQDHGYILTLPISENKYHFELIDNVDTSNLSSKLKTSTEPEIHIPSAQLEKLDENKPCTDCKPSPIIMWAIGLLIVGILIYILFKN